ncbi:MAG: hypothetical protein FJY82_12030 [Candidatus Aminicenantes bacterium]|nr:hypothetical protein [Candidatus Aminicenantes bacterium]
MCNTSLFRSWKEISAYLGVDKRTCLRWEKKLALPVHRIEGGAKGSVFAYKEELDAWILVRSGQHPKAVLSVEDESGEKGHPPTISREELSRLIRGRVFRQILAPPRTRRLLIGFHVLAIAAIAALFFLLRVKPMSRSPHGFRIEGEHLVVLNPRGKEIWRKDTGFRDLLGQDFYGSRLQTRRLDETERAVFPCLAFKDIDLDGGREVLFAAKTADEMSEGVLFCYAADGRERWRFKAGRDLVFGDRLFPADYRIQGFDLCDIDRNGDLEILLLAFHKPDWPCQFVLLDARGKILGEYWNAGQWSDFQVVDLNGDGRVEIVAAGVNNEYRTGVLAVFDPAQVSGMSPQLESGFRSAGLSRGTEKFYVRLPRVPFLRPEEPVESAKSLFLYENKDISVLMAESGLFAHFNSALVFLGFSSSHTFERQVNLLLAGGKIALPPSDFLETLGKKVLYWDGQARAWTPRQAMSSTW